ncbi:hypothetical protein NDU88_007855 [Pleurodeles waltl]|uniref:Uncharacterized protein n=1 Tax=Pleurodeles waltl TaxID=8319 RepID=A0AAV7STK8_PLEWA|nr:hypothetical protein NDU88_007855 [Pleurodeles waltl]
MITLLYKQKGDREDLKNWRSILLLNVDYKILAKAMANRLKKVSSLAEKAGGEVMGGETGEDESETGTLEPPEADDRGELFGPAERDPASASVHRTSVTSAASNGQGHQENNLPLHLRQRSARHRHHPEGNLCVSLREEDSEDQR